MVRNCKKRSLRTAITLFLLAAALWVPAFRSTAHAGATFTKSTTLATAPHAAQIVTGDFNGDGKSDIAVSVGGASGGVDVYLSQGDGTFRGPVFYPTGAGANGLAVGRFTNSGKADLAVANGGSGTVSLLLGNGDGTFRPAVTTRVGANSFALTVDDFNQDGREDLAVVYDNGQTGPQLSSSVKILLGNGDGTFTTGKSFSVPTTQYVGVSSISSDDLNADGHPDLVVAGSSNLFTRSGSPVTVFFGNGDGTFGRQESVNGGPSVQQVVLYDLARDNTPSLVFANLSFHSNNGGVYTIAGTRSGPYGQPTVRLMGQNIVGLAIDHFSGVPPVDIAAVSDVGLVTILSGGADYSFSAGASASGIAAGSFKGNGPPDLAVLDSQNSQVSVFLNTTFRGGPTGGTLTATPALNPSSNPYYGEEDLTVSVTAPLTSLHVTVTVQKSGVLSYAGQYTTFPAGSVVSSQRDTGGTIVYSYDLAPGQTVPVGSYTIGSQFNGDGTAHDYNSDTYTVSGNAGSGATTLSGHFSTPAGTTPPPAAKVTATGSVAPGSSAYYVEEDIALNTAAPITVLHLGVNVQKMPGVTYAGQYTTFPAGTVTSSHTETGSAIQYTYDLVPGRTLPGGSYTIGSQSNGDGRPHSLATDGFSGTATSNGTTVPLSGDFHQ